MVEVMLKLAYSHHLSYPTTEESLENFLSAVDLFQMSTKYEFRVFEELAIIGFTVCLSSVCDQASKGQSPTLSDLTRIIRDVYGVPTTGN